MAMQVMKVKAGRQKACVRYREGQPQDSVKEKIGMWPRDSSYMLSACSGL